MYQAIFETKIIISNIFNQLKHVPSNTLVAQWVHPLRLAQEMTRPVLKPTEETCVSHK